MTPTLFVYLSFLDHIKFCKVALNIFEVNMEYSVHSTQIECVFHPTGWEDRKLRKISEHFQKAGATYDNWKKNAWLALTIYMQLARDFGWNSYVEVNSCN